MAIIIVIHRDAHQKLKNIARKGHRGKVLQFRNCKCFATLQGEMFREKLKF